MKKGAIIVEGDLMKPDSLLPVCEGVDVVVSAVGNNQTKPYQDKRMRSMQPNNRA